MGSAEPRSFSRGKRGIAGSLVFTIFDRDALVAGLADHVKKEQSFHRIGGDNENANEYARLSIDEWDKNMTSIANNGVSDSTNTEAGAAKAATTRAKNISSVATPKYADEIPPFDITISFANEYGQKASIILYAVEILNEQSGFSIDNVVSEKACTFVARRVEYMKPIDRKSAVQ